MRAKWTQTSGLKIKDARKEAVEYLWFVGDYASYDPRCEDITKKTANVFAQAGLDFGLLYEAERNAGNDVRRVGEEGLFEMLRDKNQQALAKAQFKKIVTTTRIRTTPSRTSIRGTATGRKFSTTPRCSTGCSRPARCR